VPAAAVIPAPIAYIKVVAVKKLVVGFLVKLGWSTARWALLWFAILSEAASAINLVLVVAGTFTLKKLECSKQAYAWIH
jgi:hypothetical protein